VQGARQGARSGRFVVNPQSRVNSAFVNMPQMTTHPSDPIIACTICPSYAILTPAHPTLSHPPRACILVTPCTHGLDRLERRVLRALERTYLRSDNHERFARASLAICKKRQEQWHESTSSQEVLQAHATISSWVPKAAAD
jgi:hypothetical protein